MSFDVFPLGERGAEYDAALARFTERQRDVPFLRPWLLLWQQRGDGRAMAALQRDEGGSILYPFLLRDLDAVPYLGAGFAGTHDITTPPGYGGPLVERGAGDDAVAVFRARFDDWCRGHRVVSEFVRFHPLLDNRLPFRRHLDVGEAGSVVWCRFDRGSCRVSDQLDAAARRNVRAARDAGLACGIETQPAAYERFAELYADNAERRRALPAERFDAAHVLRLRESLGGSHTLFGVRRGKELVAAALFLRSRDFVHLHALAADRRHAALRPVNLLLFEALTWAKGLGVSAVDLGGGYRGDDELYRLKAGFTQLRAPRFVGRAIHLFEEYGRADEARAARGEVLDCDFFPGYRSPLPGEGPLG